MIIQQYTTAQPGRERGEHMGFSTQACHQILQWETNTYPSLHTSTNSKLFTWIDMFMNGWVCTGMTFDHCVKSFLSLSPSFPLSFHAWCVFFGEAHFAAQTWFCWPQGRAGENNHVSAMLGQENRNTNMALKTGVDLSAARNSSYHSSFFYVLLPAPTTLSFLSLSCLTCCYKIIWPRLIVSLKHLPAVKATFSITVRVIKMKY